MVKTISSHMDHRIQQEYGNRLGPEQQTLIAELHALLAAVKGAELTNHLPARADRSVWECRHHIITFIMLYIVLSLKLAADKQRQA